MSLCSIFAIDIKLVNNNWMQDDMSSGLSHFAIEKENYNLNWMDNKLTISQDINSLSGNIEDTKIGPNVSDVNALGKEWDTLGI